MEKNIELEISSLLPGVENDHDGCIKRLETALQNNHKMQRAHLERGNGALKLCLHYDPETISVNEVKRLARRAGVAIINRYHHELINIEDMDCSDCALVLEHSLERLGGVLDASASYAAGNIWVEYDNYTIDRRAIEKRITSLGYHLPVAGPRKWLRQNRLIIFSALTGLLLLAGWAGGKFLGFPYWASLALYILAYAAGGWDVSLHALHALRARYFDTDLLMLIAALGAAILGDFAEGALLIFLFSLGHALEDKALNRARNAIRALGSLVPKTALVQRGGTEIELPVAQLALKDRVVIRPGARIPVDGIVQSGQSSVDQSPVTGESIPVDKTSGEQVYAGTINGEGALAVQVTRLAADSTLARVMKLVEEAQAQKSPTQRLMERFERAFVPGVLGATLLAIVIPPLLGAPFGVSFLRAMTLLVAASPCALALGAPAAALAGIAQAARGGVLVKGGAHLENLGRLKAIAFDKTGTITHGKPEVTGVYAFIPDAYPEEKILAIAAAVEIRSGHPFAQAVVRQAQDRNIPLAEIGAVESLTGRGLQATCAGQTVLVGSLRFLEESGIAIPERVSEQLAQLEASGQSVILVAMDARVAGALALSDTLRPEVRAAMAGLHKQGITSTIMLTGDNLRVAAAIADQAGMSEFYAGLLPEDKSRAIAKLVQGYGVVAMVGDGVNDAPALASATVGIAMGGAATDVALETADVALMSNNLARLPFAIGLGRATRRTIIQNLAIALGVIGLLSVAALAGWVGIGIAVLFHEGSTVVVVLNALRLLGYSARG